MYRINNRPTVSQLSASAGLLAISFALASPAFAQDSAPAAAGQEAQAPAGDHDIIVTALRRNERLQEAPAALSVVTAATIESAGVKSLSDVSRIVPSLRFEAGLRPGVPSISLRGIAAVQGGDAPFSLLVDGVQMPFLELVNQDLLDISGIELLKGPQGSLYGRGAIAGALLINTQQPDDHFRAKLSLSAEEGADYRAAATVSGPIIDGILAAKVTVGYQNRRGLIQVRTLNEPGDYVDQGTIRGQLRFTPSHNTTIDLFGSYTRGTVGWANMAIVPVGVPGAIEDFATYKPDRNFRNYNERRIWNVALKINHKTDIGTITSVTQYAYAFNNTNNDFDYSPVAGRVNHNPILDKAFNEDIRFTSDLGGAIDFTVGAFYQKRIGHNDVNLTPDPAAIPPLLPSLFTFQHFTSEAYAGYAQVNIKLPAGFSATGAVRYDVDRRFDELTNVPGSGVNDTFRAWQPSATIKQQFTRDLMAYATFGRGFRSGGFNAQNLVSPAIGAQRIYPKELSTNYEVGFKSQFLDHRFTLNAAIFQTDFENSQFQQTLAVPVVARFITSIPKVRVKGLEADATFRITPELTLSGSLSITDAIVRDYNGTSLYIGHQAPNVYHDSTQISIEYKPQLNDTYRGLFRLDGNRRGRISYDLSEDFTYKPVNFLDARIGVETDKWSLAVYGRNLTNTRAPEFFSALAFRIASARLENLPFRAGVEFTMKFGAQ